METAQCLSIQKLKGYQIKLVRFQRSQLSTSSNVQWVESRKLFPNAIVCAENVLITRKTRKVNTKEIHVRVTDEIC